MSFGSGAVLSDRYRLTGSIAVGGMGEVWRAHDTVLDREVAVKLLKHEYSSDPEFSERFRSEAKLTARISHPGVAAVYDYGRTEDPAGEHERSYLVMELVEGDSLATILKREGPLAPGVTTDLLEQTARALHSAHSIGLVHRDVKPGNILVTRDGTAKLTDFGIAKAMGAASVTQSGMIVGTAQYIAPEQAMGEEATPAGDVYSLAVVGYECLAGQRPFRADSPVTLAMKHVREDAPPLPEGVPQPIMELLDFGMAKKPEWRYRDGAEFADAIGDVRRGRQPRPPAGLDGSAGGGTAAGVAGAAAAGAAGAAAGAALARGGDGTRAYTRLGSGEHRPAELPPTRSGPASQQRAQQPSRAAQAPPRRPAPQQPAPRRGGSGQGMKALVALLAVLAIALIIGLLVLVLDDRGTFDNLRNPATTTPTTTVEEPAPVPTVTETQVPQPTQQPQPTSEPTQQPEPTQPTGQPGATQQQGQPEPTSDPAPSGNQGASSPQTSKSSANSSSSSATAAVGPPTAEGGSDDDSGDPRRPVPDR